MNEKKNQNEFSRLLSYMKNHLGSLIAGVIMILLGCIAYALAPLFMGEAINLLGKIFGGDVSGEATGGFLRFLLLMAGCYGLYALFSYLSTRVLVSATQNAVRDLRAEIDRKLSRLPLNYYDTTTYGDILARLTNDVENVSMSLQSVIGETLKAAFTLVIIFLMMVGISGWLTLFGLITIPVLLVITSKLSARSSLEFDRQMTKTGEINGYVEEYYSGHNVVALFGKEEEVQNRFDALNRELYNASYQANYLAGVLYPISMASNNLGYAVVSLIGAMMAIAGGLSIGMIQAFTQYLNQFSTALSTVMQLSAQIQTISSASRRIFEFLDEQEEVPEAEHPAFPEKLAGRVEFDHVRFGYQPHQTLMHDLNETVYPGQKCAIVGPTGAGKTTMVNLIMRFYDVTGGAIRIDGVDIRDMRRSDLRNIFGMVLQDTWLFHGTIMENIRYGKLDATDEEVIAAAKAACADGFIDTLPGGYQFVLAEGAGNIAQGQRQLLTIARAILNNPPIMILDEATSSVDTRTEGLIQTAMSNIMKGRTSFVIAHRLSTIRDSAKILYMEKGDVLETGTHEELMALNNRYARLYNSQFADKA